MTSVESAVPVKTPEPDQYWEHVKSKDRVYFIGRNPEGEMVWQCEGDTVEVGNLDWSDWQHIPDCTGWDWEFEAFPHYYVGTKWCDGTAYVVRESETKSHAVGRSGNKFKYDWDGAAKRFVAIGTLVRITEAEAMARLDKPAEQWPKYYVTVTDSRHYYRCDSADEVWAVTENGEERQGSPASALLDTAVWKQVTEAEAFARVVKPAEPDSDPPPFAKPFTNARSGIGIRKDAVAWRPARQPYEVATDVTYQAETPVESPNGWVVQDRVPARPGIDQGWWAYKGDAVDPSGSSWWDFQSTDSAAGKEHGYPHIEGYVLHLRCRRKDLPAVPAPIEETFPQWYILKESEVHQALTPWAIKRTGEETSIRYAYDGGDKLLASNETWYGATDVWRQCHSAEAFQRLGILGEAYLPAVPADKRRVPIKAWVTYRLADEGGDWPVRATPADQTYQNWKEIKFDSNGMFIEVDQ